MNEDAAFAADVVVPGHQAWSLERLATIFWGLDRDLEVALADAGTPPDVARVAAAVWKGALLDVCDGTRLLPPKGFPLQFAGIREVAEVLNGTEAGLAIVVRTRHSLSGRPKRDAMATEIIEALDSAKHLWDMPKCEACGGNGRLVPKAWAAIKGTL